MRETIERRDFLKAGAATGAVLAIPGCARLATGDTQSAPVTVNSKAVTVAKPQAKGRLVVVFLRGGQDHLSLTVPFADSAYYDRRPTIAVPESAALKLDDRFGLHPAMPGLHQLFAAKRLGVVVATGNPAGDRSHFFAQDLSEFGDVQVPGDGHGWLGRHLLASEVADPSPFRAMTLGNNVTASLRGYPALGLGSIQSFGLGGLSGATKSMGPALRAANGGSGAVATFGRQALDAAAEVASLSGSKAQDPVGRAFGDIAILLEAELGVEVVTANLGGWDTHNAMGTHKAGEMSDLMSGLDTALANFQADLDKRKLSDVTTVVVTEFGRRVDENGSGGCDHGWGSAMLVIGGATKGGVHGNWPGLADNTISPRFDVPVTTDFRDVLGDLVVEVLGADPSTVFPGHKHTRVGVTA